MMTIHAFSGDGLFCAQCGDGHSVHVATRYNDAPKSWEERFAKFHRENPHVYRELVRLARIARGKGLNKYSMKALFEILRWNHVTTTGEEFKLNNCFTRFYSRLIQEQEPDLRGFFENRERK